MPVTNIHILYRDHQQGWQEVRDCVEGNRAIKGKGQTYLPKLSGQTIEEWEFYQKKTKFFGATGRALDGMHGNIFRKAPEQSEDISDSFALSLEDVDLMGTSIDQFASDIIYDCLQTNWGGVLADYARGEEAASLLDAEQKGLKAYLKYYKAEQVINWEYKTIRGRTMLFWVVLVEQCFAPDVNDRFTSQEYKKYRVLYLDQFGHYCQDVYDDRINLSIPVEQAIQIKMNGEYLNEIPFYTLPGLVPEKSMLYDLAQLNLQHYIDTADYQNGKHYTSVPTPIAIGLEPEYDEQGKPKPMYIGGTKFQYFPNKDNVSGADVKFLEFTGQGMKALADGIIHLETQMAILGAHIIAAEKKGVESAEALRIHRIGENGVLAAFTRNISDQLTKALRMKGKWDGEAPDKLDKWSINFNTDYDLTEENVQTLTALLTGRAQGEIPRISLYMGLKALNLIPEQWDYETFIEEQEKDKLVLPDLVDNQDIEDDEGDDDQDIDNSPDDKDNPPLSPSRPNQSRSRPGRA
jgi:hypothetical protein